MKPAGLGNAALAGRLAGIGGAAATSAGGIPGAVAHQPIQGVAATGDLSQIRYASTWPRGWMAAAVPQRVREFNVQAGKAQLTQAFLDTLQQKLELLERALRHQMQLPSPAGLERANQALQQVKDWWSERWTLTWASLDECLSWSPVLPARKAWLLKGWTGQTLQANGSNDRELVAFCLMGQDHAHGAWLAEQGRSPMASRFALAAALAPLSIQLDAVDSDGVVLSTAEAHWPAIQDRWMVRGGGRRFPSGQWVSPQCVPLPSALRVPHWMLHDEEALPTVLSEVTALYPRIQAVVEQLQTFQQAARSSVEHATPDQLQRMQTFAHAFAQAGQAPAYDWVLAVVPAVRAISRLRVARLLRTLRPLD